MPSEELRAMLKMDFGKFFIVKVEEMYKHVKGQVPASRSTIHTCLYITSGEAIMKIGSERYKIHKDELLFVPAGQVFSFEEGDVNKGYLCSFHNDMLIGKSGKKDPLKDFEFLRVWGNPKITLDKQASQFILHIFKRMLADYSENGLQHTSILQSYLLTLLYEASLAYQFFSPGSQAVSVNISNRFRELIFSNIKTRHLVSDYASLLNITPNHLNKTVKAITGKSPGKWIDEAIVLEAKVLLYQTVLSISEVAIEVGIEDQSYFTRLFKKQEGLTPSAFRRMIEKS